MTRTAIEYDDQYLTIEAVPNRSPDAVHDAEAFDELTQLVETFPDRLEEHKKHWRGTVAKAKADGKTVVLWGSGSKAVSFLTLPDIADAVDFVTDINPNRQGHFMPGTGHPIIAPDQLKDIDPGLVVVMNRIYEDEISQPLAEMGIDCAVECL